MARPDIVLDRFVLTPSSPEEGQAVEVYVLMIDPNGPRYDEERAVRDEVLRRPIGLIFDATEFPFEPESMHLLAVTGSPSGRAVATVLIHPEPPRARLFQMAVVADLRGKGLGRRLVWLAERLALERGVTLMELHSRRRRASFYQLFGYEEVGAPFLEIGMEHVLMEKSLSRR